MLNRYKSYKRLSSMIIIAVRTLCRDDSDPANIIEFHRTCFKYFFVCQVRADRCSSDTMLSGVTNTHNKEEQKKVIIRGKDLSKKHAVRTEMCFCLFVQASIISTQHLTFRT